MDSEERGLQGFQALSQYFLGYARLHQGDYSQATHCAKSALPLAEQTCEYEIFSQAQMLVAAVDLAKGRYDKAREGFPEAIEIGQQKRYVKVLFGEGCGKFGLVCSQLELGDTKTARQILLDYLLDAVTAHRLDKLLYAFSGLALLNMNLGNEQLAHYLFRITSSYPFVRNSQWFNDVMREPIRKNLNHIPDGEEKMIDHKGIWEYSSYMISNI